MSNSNISFVVLYSLSPRYNSLIKTMIFLNNKKKFYKALLTNYKFLNEFHLNNTFKK